MKNAFLYTDLHGQIYMLLQPGFVHRKGKEEAYTGGGIEGKRVGRSHKVNEEEKK